MNLTIVTPPTVEPVLLETVKQSAHIDHNIEDDIIRIWIKSARIKAEAYHRKAYITRTYDLTLDGFPVVPFDLPYPPLQSITSIKYYDTDDTEYLLDLNTLIQVDISGIPGRINLKYNQVFPSTVLREMASVIIRFVAGYGGKESDIPENVKDAISLYCTWRNENRAEEEEAPKEFYNLLRFDR